MMLRLGIRAFGMVLMMGLASTARAACDPGAAADPAMAAQAAQIGAALPLTYVGTFQWDGSDAVQDVTMSFSRCSIGSSIRLLGRGAYLDSGARIDVIADVAGTAIILLESNPEGGVGAFVTEGRHSGDIAPDLSRICAIWVTDRDGSTGRLRLGRMAEDAERCGVHFTS